jgi:hypothetical protein
MYYVRVAGVICPRMARWDLFRQGANECRRLAAGARYACDKAFWLNWASRQALKNRLACLMRFVMPKTIHSAMRIDARSGQGSKARRHVGSIRGLSVEPCAADGQPRSP